MKQWWQGLQRREQLTLLLGGIALGLIVYVFALWLPAHREVASLREQVREERATLEWMRQAALEVRALGGGPGNGARPQDSRSLAARIDAAARAAGLQESLRVESSGQRQVRLSFDNTPFDPLIGWLVVLRNEHGIRASTASFRSAEATGRVDAQLILEAAE
ncbi:type II secretion system protein GspM [Alkalilimnicola sp. S0819]|uniref:type II secretion system protein GspM n=1 Tax=Alkalilimnicola sp. S0819 TaxID=2613922 RepID=UPI0012619175|nr:type II secretion system protein GspM [Alkalilimnicola sp. S0819]KAB7622987.1 type II secretion system protein M [Alkalilimnicola sp. S0819]MPQ17097.1 hypothetical protein [Alkalilimnicola sp. S0819]